jgi:hypothetical protein
MSMTDGLALSGTIPSIKGTSPLGIVLQEKQKRQDAKSTQNSRGETKKPFRETEMLIIDRIIPFFSKKSKKNAENQRF